MRNQVMLIGRIGNIQYKKFENNSSVCNISLAIEDNYYNEEKVLVERTQWIDCVGQNKTAELLNQFFKQGNQLAIVGKLRKREYTQDEKKHFVTEVVIQNIEFSACRTERAEN